MSQTMMAQPCGTQTHTERALLPRPTTLAAILGLHVDAVSRAWAEKYPQSDLKQGIILGGGLGFLSGLFSGLRGQAGPEHCSSLLQSPVPTPAVQEG